MTTILEALALRRDRALASAADAARSTTGPGDLAGQVRLEVSLEDLDRYQRLAESLARTARNAGPYTEHRSTSILADLNQPHDREARERLAAHRANSTTDLHEQRAVGTAGFVGLTVPSYLLDAAAPAALARSALAAQIAAPLPAGGLELVLAGWTTLPAAQAQSAQNTASTESDLALTATTVNVRAYHDHVDISRQMFDRNSAGLDAVVLPTLIEAVDAKIGTDLYTADGTSGTIPGIVNSSPGTVTYTDASPTILELFPKIEEAVRASIVVRKAAPNLLVAHPRRLSWIREKLTTENLATSTVTSAGWGSLQIIEDAAIPTNLGAGTNQDLIVVTHSDTLRLYWSEPLVQIATEPAAGTNTVRVVVSRYVAFTNALMPTATQLVTGTGLAL